MINNVRLSWQVIAVDIVTRKNQIAFYVSCWFYLRFSSSDMNCSCICEDRQITFLQTNSRSMEQRLIELQENLTIAKRKTTSEYNI
jgi:hypothetical protein